MVFGLFADFLSRFPQKLFRDRFRQWNYSALVFAPVFTCIPAHAPVFVGTRIEKKQSQQSTTTKQSHLTIPWNLFARLRLCRPPYHRWPCHQEQLRQPSNQSTSLREGGCPLQGSWILWLYWLQSVEHIVGSTTRSILRCQRSAISIVMTRSCCCFCYCELLTDSTIRDYCELLTQRFVTIWDDMIGSG